MEVGYTGRTRTRLRVLLVRQLISSFVASDIRLLRSRFAVLDYDYRSSSHPALHLIRWMLDHRADFDIVVVWFGDVHATVAILAAFFLRKPSAILVGGYDVSALPGHGFLATPRGRFLARIHFSLCTQILPVAPSLVADLVKIFPGAERKTRVIPTGCDTDFWSPGPGGNRDAVLSVALAGDRHRVYVKGLDRVVECGRHMPQRRFKIVGLAPEIAPQLSPFPPNLSWKPPISPVELRSEYRSAMVYLQLSRAEGLPNVLTEAMACGCIPVVTNIGGMSDLVNGAGFVVNPDDIDGIVAAIERAFDHGELQGRCRERVEQGFALDRRERELSEAIEALVHSTARDRHP